MATRTKSRIKSRRRNWPAGTLQFVRVVKTNREPKLELREKLKMTREAFGRLVNVSVRAIAAAERDQKDVAKLERPQAIERLLRACNRRWGTDYRLDAVVETSFCGTSFSVNGLPSIWL